MPPMMFWCIAKVSKHESLYCWTVLVLLAVLVNWIDAFHLELYYVLVLFCSFFNFVFLFTLWIELSLCLLLILTGTVTFFIFIFIMDQGSLIMSVVSWSWFGMYHEVWISMYMFLLWYLSSRSPTRQKVRPFFILSLIYLFLYLVFLIGGLILSVTHFCRCMCILYKFHFSV